MSGTSLSIHRVRSVDVTHHESNGTHWTEYMFRTEDEEVEVTIFHNGDYITHNYQHEYNGT